MLCMKKIMKAMWQPEFDSEVGETVIGKCCHFITQKRDDSWCPLEVSLMLK